MKIENLTKYEFVQIVNSMIDLNERNAKINEAFSDPLTECDIDLAPNKYVMSFEMLFSKVVGDENILTYVYEWLTGLDKFTFQNGMEVKEPADLYEYIKAIPELTETTSKVVEA